MRSLFILLSTLLLAACQSETYYSCRQDGGSREMCGTYHGIPASGEPIPGAPPAGVSAGRTDSGVPAA